MHPAAPPGVQIRRHVRWFRTTTLVYANYTHSLARLYRRRTANLFGLVAHPQLEVELAGARIGLFAQLNCCIQLAAAAAAHGRRIHFVCTSRNYSPDGTDWLDSVLRQKVESRAWWPSLRVRLADLREFPFPTEPAFELTIDRARAVFAQTFDFAPEVLAGAAALQARWPHAATMVGVHYRGTDKASEAKPVPIDAAVQLVGETECRFRQHGVTAVHFFVATDAEAMVDAMRERFGADRVHVNPHAERSDSRDAVHLSIPRSLRRARDAMTDALLLSRCPVLVRTSSFLSGWSTVFARRQHVLMMNHPYAHTRWFPDSEIMNFAYWPAEVDLMVDDFLRSRATDDKAERR